MTLSFSQQINGKPNYFIEKIWEGLNFDFKEREHRHYADLYKYEFGMHWDGFEVMYEAIKNGLTSPYIPKLHTIRHDPHDRWKAGMDIHPVINNRTENRFQFAPVIKCVSVQSFSINYKDVIVDDEKLTEKYTVIVDGRELEWREIEKLAINDGFESTDEFISYFNKDFTGKIIHWTDLRY